MTTSTHPASITPAATPDGAGPGRIIHACMVLVDEASPPRYGAAHCSFTDTGITCELEDEAGPIVVAYPAGDPFGPVLAELFDRYLVSKAAEPE